MDVTSLILPMLFDVSRRVAFGRCIKQRQRRGLGQPQGSAPKGIDDYNGEDLALCRAYPCINL